jgi:energy-coupling factor transporter ATP-binding protein EcfA2
VLAVGDARFRAKCYDVIYRFIREKAVVMVSHDMMHIARACSRLLVLGNGKATLFKDVYQGIDQYLAAQKIDQSMAHEGSAARLSQLTASTPSGEATFKPGGILEIGFTLEFLEPCTRARIIVSVLDRSLTPVAANVIEDDTSNPPFKRRYRLEVTSLPLAAGLYKISVSVFQADTPRQLLWHYAVKDLPVNGEASFLHTPVRLVGNWSVDGIRRPVS